MLFFSVRLWAATPCEEASQRVSETVQLDSIIHRKLQKELLQQALALCPDHPLAHYHFGAVLAQEKNYTEALYHYQQALTHRPNYSPAWVGIGNVYSKQGQRPLGFEAYLSVCTRNRRARQRVTELLRGNRYRIVDGDVVLSNKSLSLLYDRKRLQNLYQMANRCYRHDKSIASHSMALKAILQPVAIFRQIDYEVGKEDLTLISEAQLEEIALALINIDARRVIIRGHSARQPFKGKTLTESKPLIWQLSRNRAKSVAAALAVRGFNRSRISYYGYGASRPLVRGNNKAAWVKNRRVEVEVSAQWSVFSYQLSVNSDQLSVH